MGVNTFLNPQPPEETEEIQLARSTDDEKYMQINIWNCSIVSIRQSGNLH
ncbi:MAG: hypothetical protein Ct9H90mP9_2980 [Pseudomonadota bacterium]|nr:MAG: hypothetical protein Ct9H90mP9_2980 [Pseudomonadota bacterium]